MGSTPWPSGLERRNTRSRHLVLWSRNHEYSPLREMTDLTIRVWVRSLGTILGRCQAPKTARPVGRLPLIVSYVFILLKTHSTFHLNTHTHTHNSIHLSIQHGILSQTLHTSIMLITTSQTLAYIYHGNQPTLAYIYHHGQGRAQA